MSKKTGRSWVLGVEELKEYHETSRKMAFLNLIGFVFFSLLGCISFVINFEVCVFFMLISIFWLIVVFIWLVRAMVVSVIVEIRLKK